MPVEIVMPKLGLTMTEGLIVEWRKKEGDPVTKGDILFVLETEKVTYEVEAPEAIPLQADAIQDRPASGQGMLPAALAEPPDDRLI